MIQICSLRSGSSGNAVLVFTDKTKILIDCGISGKSIAACLANIDISADDLDAILITHEHSDHVLSAGIMCRRHKIPVFANKATWNAMRHNVGKVDTQYIKYFEGNMEFEIGDIFIRGFSIPHDAADPIGYSFLNKNNKVSIATDIGHINDTVFEAIQGSDMVLLEANHDVNMLDIGRYPMSVKRRIKSNNGHLSNEAAGEFASMLVNSGTKQILLGHLSEENNTPDLAYATVKMEFDLQGIAINNDVLLDVAKRGVMSKIYKAG